MSFMDDLLGLFGVSKRKPNKYSQIDLGKTVPRRKNRQVYEGRPVPLPEWGEGLNKSGLIKQIQEHVVCKYAPNFGMKKTMTTIIGKDGNLVPEYEGIAGDCGAVRNFGMKVAIQDGMSMPYRYVNATHAYATCCENPKRCPFYQAAESDAAMMAAKMKRV